MTYYVSSGTLNSTNSTQLFIVDLIFNEINDVQVQDSDTVRHATLIDKMAQLRMPGQIFNWIKDFFDKHSHCTKYSGVSSHASIQGSVIQESGLGRAST